MPWNVAEGDAPGDYHDVNANFQVIGIWGFFQYLFIFLMWYWIMCTTHGDYSTCKPLSMMFNILGYTGHFLTLMILRWRHAGKVCSGDYYSEVNRFSLFEANAPYLHNAGSFYYYAIIS